MPNLSDFVNWFKACGYVTALGANDQKKTPPLAKAKHPQHSRQGPDPFSCTPAASQCTFPWFSQPFESKVQGRVVECCGEEQALPTVKVPEGATTIQNL